MTVPASQRSKPNLEAVEKARELAAYTIHITSNPKVFKPEYQTALTNDIVHCAKEIYTCSWKANNINVGEPPKINEEARKDRERLQRIAVANCYELLSLIQLAKPVFHLTAKRVKYWGRFTVTCRSILQAWKESDSRRYSKK